MTESKETPPTGQELRHRLLSLVRGDLVGPAGGAHEEVDEGRVSDRYLAGMLAPKRQFRSAETDEPVAPAGAGNSDDGATDESSPATPSTMPSSFGFTCTVDGDVSELRIRATWGRYERGDSDVHETESGKPKKVWRRVPEGGEVSLPLVVGDVAPTPVDPDWGDVTIRGRVRRQANAAGKDVWIVTLFLVNGQTEPDKLKDEHWLFQAELSAEGVDGSGVFVRQTESSGRDEEAAEMAMLYRKRVEFASGHGVAVHATPLDGNPWRATKIESRVLPMHEIGVTEAPTAEDEGFEKLAGLELDMLALADTPTKDFASLLSPLVDAYGAWIDVEKGKISDPAQGLADHMGAANRVLERCERARSRIQEGIELLSADETVAECFRFANRAMALQRIHSIHAESVRRQEPVGLAELGADATAHSWRPFQLAFVLLNLASTTNLHHEDRIHPTEALADLLWFPTGGGKTEAYLGLAAYVLALRRLQGEVEGRDGQNGVAVLMRYTLRLLTLQQFQRASALICACEKLRRDHPERWGETPFRIGLWVGSKATPNRTSDAAEVIKAGRGAWNDSVARAGTPAQLGNCPWCGCRIDPGTDIRVELVGSGRGRTITFCGDEDGVCEFGRRKSQGEGLPVVVVDEEIYRLLPSLVIATVDKFAQMPWAGPTQALFGQVDSRCSRHGFRTSEIEDADRHNARKPLPKASSSPHADLRPPDLIIQDELHLISGPLGSMVGAYETVVDELCTWEVGGKRVRPKVIASTATIRRAGEQIHSLFLRKVEIFPPPGTSADDNFFSVMREPTSERPGRLYLGVCSPGKRLKASLIRVYLAFLGGAQKLYEAHGREVDPWMTLVGYFNSIRELAGMRRLVDDDIRTRLRRIDIRGLGKRQQPVVEELTSRKNSTEIPRVLDRLEAIFDPADEELRRGERKKGKWPPSKPRPYDVLLATNMVSVGVDVKRLGLMVTAGQPKTTAEYIQATSRVGRHHPGIVCTVYNWARPRDLSHFERFEHYHGTFYERVEALSVTPFAARALDRSLSALLVSLIRLRGETFNANDKAAEIDATNPLVKRAIETISARAAEVRRDANFGAEVRAMLEQRVDFWLAQLAGSGGRYLGFKRKKDGVTVPLLRDATEDRWETFTCLNSLRDVEPTSALVLLDDPTRRQAPAAPTRAGPES